MSAGLSRTQWGSRAEPDSNGTPWQLPHLVAMAISNLGDLTSGTPGKPGCKEVMGRRHVKGTTRRRHSAGQRRGWGGGSKVLPMSAASCPLPEAPGMHAPESSSPTSSHTSACPGFEKLGPDSYGPAFLDCVFLSLILEGAPLFLLFREGKGVSGPSVHLQVSESEERPMGPTSPRAAILGLPLVNHGTQASLGPALSFVFLGRVGTVTTSPWGSLQPLAEDLLHRIFSSAAVT